VPQGYRGGSGRRCQAPFCLGAAASGAPTAAIRQEGAGPSCRPGPRAAFLVTRNFDAIYAYNAAESYRRHLTLATGCGRRALVGSWPTDDPACRAPNARRCRPADAAATMSHAGCALRQDARPSRL